MPKIFYEKIYLLFFFVFLTNVTQAQNRVLEIWTNYDGFWNSSSTSINPVRPDNSHELLAFRYGTASSSIVYSTGVNNQKLDDNGVTYVPLNFRALPIAFLPTTSSQAAYFVGFGQLFDGLNDAVDNGTTIPFAPITSGSEVASYLTDGRQGLELGTNITNIPSGTTARFNLSSAGISVDQLADGIPDVLVSQAAQPTNSGFDQLEFVDAVGATVGNIVQLNIINEPIVGNWVIDFYQFNSTQPISNFVNTQREIRFFAIDFSSFGINAANAGNAVALLYRPGGSSDPAFIAFNEPSLGVSAQLSVLSGQPTIQNCDGTLPSDIEVQLEDQNGFAVAQENITVTASLASGPGDLIGTLTRNTNSVGVATFDDLEFTVGGNHIIQFSFSSLEDGFTSVISDASGCNIIQWTGNTDSNWSDATNWSPQEVPDANNDVIIPNGRPNYPVLDIDAGAKNLTMGSDASIDLNGFLFALNGNMDNVSNGASIDASFAGSELFMSAVIAQNIPANFISEDVAKFTIENANGVTLNSSMNISEVLSVREGTLTSNDHITMLCTFIPRQTAQIDRLVGTITGDVTVEQCFPARRAFRLVSSSTSATTSIRENWQEGAATWDDDPSPNPNSDPNTSGYGTHITGLGVQNTTPGTNDGVNGFDWQPSGNPSMYTFSNDPSQAWAPINNTNTNTLNAGEPYRLMIRGDRSVDIRFNNSAPTNTKLRSTGSIAKGPIPLSLGINNGQFALIGNPFHAIVDMRSVLSISNNLSQSFAVWDPTLGGTPIVGSPGGRGAFVTVNATNNTTNNSNSEMTRYLQPYQAAFVFATGDSPTLTFRETDKAVIENQVDVFSTTPDTYVNLLLFDQLSFNNNDTPDDGLAIYFSPYSSNAIDNQDAPKFGNMDENLARLENSTLLSYENRAMPEAGEELTLFMNHYRSSDYVLEIQVGNFPNTNVYLKDDFTNDMHLLVAGQNHVSFQIDASLPSSLSNTRFSIVFEDTNLSSTEVKLEQIQVYPNPAKDRLFITYGQDTDTFDNIDIYDVTGRWIARTAIIESNQNNIQVDISELQSGIYILKIEGKNQQYIQKVIVE